MCPNEAPNEKDTSWPTANSRINWARHNHSKKTAEEQLHKFLVALMNLTALNDLLEEQGVGQFFSRTQTEEWKGWYETWRPTQAVGRPKTNNS